MCFNQRGDIFTLNRRFLKTEAKLTYLGSSVSTTENDIITWLAKAWTAISRLSVIWKSDQSDKIKRRFSKLRSCQYCCMDAPHRRWLSVCIKTRRQLRKNAARNIEQVQEAESQKAAAIRTPTTHLENHPSWTSKTCRWSKSELISDVALWTSSHGRARVERPARTYLQQLSTDTGYRMKDLPRAIKIGTSGGKGLGKSVLAARNDSDDSLPNTNNIQTDLFEA